MRGGEQQETKEQSVGYELDSALWLGEPAGYWRNLNRITGILFLNLQRNKDRISHGVVGDGMLGKCCDVKKGYPVVV